MGLSIAGAQTALNATFTGTQYVGYSSNGTSETANISRTAVTWNTATSADPSVKSSATAITSAAATGTVAPTHYAIFTTSTAGSQLTDWQAMTAPLPGTLNTGDTLTAASGAIRVSLT